MEEVLVVPRQTLDRRGLLRDGFHAGGVEEVLEAVRDVGRFVPRPRAEEDPSLKQIIPYGVVTCGPGAVIGPVAAARGGDEAQDDREQPREPGTGHRSAAAGSDRSAGWCLI